MKGAWVKGTGTQGFSGCSHQNFHSKGNTKVRQMHPRLTVCVISLPSFTMVLHLMKRDCQEQMGCTRLGEGISASKVDLVTW